MRKLKISIIILSLFVVLLGGEVFASSFIFGKNFIEDNWNQEEIIVKYKSDIETEEIKEINEKFGNKIIYESVLGFKKIEIPKGVDVRQMVEIYNKNPRVEYAEPDYVAQALMIPNDPYFSYQWNFKNINLERAWDISAGSDVVVAVIDTGIAYEDYWESWRKKYYQAPDLAGTTFVAGYDFVNRDRHPNDDNSHGTHIAGTIAETTNNNLGVAGVAFGAKIMPVKVLDKNGSGYYSWIADGIRYAADNGVKVINLSLGGSQYSRTLEDAVNYAYNKGVIIVAAAGNDGKDSIFYPARYEKVIAVGATRYDEEKTYYSNYGNDLDLVAPGGDLSVDQNKDGYADGILQQTFGRNFRDFNYYFFQGTSCATPHVAGVAALVLSNDLNLTPLEVRNILQSTAKDKGTLGWDKHYGWGIINAEAALNYFSEPQPESKNIPPVADAGKDQTVYVREVAVFDGSASYDPNGEIVSYEWNFGDNTTASGVTTSHIYESFGTYLVTLTVTDSEGLSAQDTAEITVEEKPTLELLNVALSTTDRWKNIKTEFSRWERVYVFIKVTSENGEPIRDTKINLTIRDSSEIVKTFSDFTDNKGELFKYIRRYSTPDIYTIEASAVKEGYIKKMATTTFEVKR